MEIDVKKVLSEDIVKSQQSLIDALHIIKSTVENFEDKECLNFNKDRMIQFFKKYSDETITTG